MAVATKAVIAGAPDAVIGGHRRQVGLVAAFLGTLIRTSEAALSPAVRKLCSVERVVVLQV